MQWMLDHTCSLLAPEEEQMYWKRFLGQDFGFAVLSNGPVSTEFSWRSWEASAEIYLPRFYLGWMGKQRSGKCSIRHSRKERIPGLCVRAVYCARQETKKNPKTQRSPAKEVNNQVFLRRWMVKNFT